MNRDVLSVEKGSFIPAIIGGTGLNSLAGTAVDVSPESAYGVFSGGLTKAEHQGVGFYFLPRHGIGHHLAPHLINYRANIWALKQQGVSHIIAVNAVGGIHSDMKSGCLVVPDQLIDYSYGREQSFFDGRNESLRHVDFSFPFSDSLRQQIISSADSLGLSCFDGAVYAVTQGPRLETAAEIRRLGNDGADIVGMTAMPEAVLARELGINYASLCLVVNPAAGVSDELITVDQMQCVIRDKMADVKAIIYQLLSDCG